MLIPGTLLQGRYRIVANLGGGGVGTVYLAENQRVSDRQCAIKELSPDQVPLQERSWVLQTLRQEVDLLSKLNHPGLTNITDYFTEGPNQYLVMEYIEGETLEAKLAHSKDQRLSQAQALEITRQLCEVLRYLHDRPEPIVFRDLKPSNIMLTAQGQVKLIDFGIARLFKPGQSHDTVNLGTPGYAAPEQYGGKGQTNPSSDIYSLGVVLHQMLTGYDPTGTPFNLPVTRTLNASVPAYLEAAIRKATHIDPKQRFQTVTQMHQALFKQVSALSRWRTGALIALIGIVGVCFILWVSSNIGSVFIPSTPTIEVVTTVPPSPTRTSTVTFTPTPVIPISPTSVAVLTPNPVLTPTIQPIPLSSPSVVTLAIVFAGLAIAVVVIGFFVKVTSGGGSQTPAASSQVPPAPIADFFQAHPSIALPSEIREGIKHTSKNPIEQLALYEDYKRLASFIAHDEGGRFVLTGYGRFGGTSLVRAAVKQAKDQLRESGQGEAALLVFSFNVKEDETQIGQFDISANDFQFGILSRANNAADRHSLQDLTVHGQAIDASTYSFGLTQPLSTSFFKRPENGLNTRKLGFDLPKLVHELHAYFDSGKKPSDLQKIVLQLAKSDALPSRVIVILDRVKHIETIEALAKLDLFQNNRISVLAVAHKEDFDQWADCERKLNQLGFRKWYVPCLWQSRADFMREIWRVLSQPGTPSASEDVVIKVLKHFEFSGKGILGEVLEEIKHPQNWASDGQGNLALFEDELARKINVKHNAWLQSVLDLNWRAILRNRFVGIDMQEAEDRARLGVYHLLDWICKERVFTRTHLMVSKENLPITISDNILLAEEVADALLQVLVGNDYLEQTSDQYQIDWDPSSPPEPKAIKVAIHVNGAGDLPKPPSKFEFVNMPSPLKRQMVFKLQLTKQDERKFDVRTLSTDDYGESHCSRELPYTTEELVTILKAVRADGYKSDDFRPDEVVLLKQHKLLVGSTFAPEWVKYVGQALYRSLFAGDVREAFQTRLRDAKHAKDTVLVLQLRFDEEAVSLAQYPWELLHADNALLRSGDVELTRYVTYPDPIPEATIQPPFQLLYIQSRPADLQFLHEEEQQATKTLLDRLEGEGIVKVNVLSQPTFEALLSYLDDNIVHILHFDGHGVYGKICPQCGKFSYPRHQECQNQNCKSTLSTESHGYLAFETEAGIVRWVDNARLHDLLNKHPIHLAVLSACRTGTVGGETLFSGVAPALIQAGIPAVVSMQLPISETGAVKFLRGFYKTWAKYEARLDALPLAVNAGRRRLMLDQEWFIPTLYLRSRD